MNRFSSKLDVKNLLLGQIKAVMAEQKLTPAQKLEILEVIKRRSHCFNSIPKLSDGLFVDSWESILVLAKITPQELEDKTGFLSNVTENWRKVRLCDETDLFLPHQNFYRKFIDVAMEIAIEKIEMERLEHRISPLPTPQRVSGN